MRDFIEINKLFSEIRKRGLTTWLDRLKFPYIFLIWAIAILLFGMVYHFWSFGEAGLFYARNGDKVTNTVDAIYFSFITATTTGFGDIVPKGIFKPLAIIEVIFGLLLLAVVTSKLVSIKQDVILNEIYEISLKERINRMRSSMFLFRQNIIRMMTRIEEEVLSRREGNELASFLSTFEDTLVEVRTLSGSGQKRFVKSIDSLSAELLSNSIVASFEKIHEFIMVADQYSHSWRRPLTVDLIRRSGSIAEGVFANLMRIRNVRKNVQGFSEQLQDIMRQIEKVID